MVTDAGSMTYEREGNSLRMYGANLRHQLCGRVLRAGASHPLSAAHPDRLDADGAGIRHVGTVVVGADHQRQCAGRLQARRRVDAAGLPALDSALQRATAPRLTAGRINLMENASVTASSTLTNAALEAGTGEFVGTLVAVPASQHHRRQPQHALDFGRRTARGDADAQGTAYFQKVFFKPLAGYTPG